MVRPVKKEFEVPTEKIKTTDHLKHQRKHKAFKLEKLKAF
jgi:hypothetical protein